MGIDERNSQYMVVSVVLKSLRVFSVNQSEENVITQPF